MASYRGKRLFDLTITAVAVVVFAPVLCCIAVLIWLEDRGSPLFRQTRVGRFRRPFATLKFRTMRDGVVTHTGKWLRRTGIDELPQFFNVWRGEMSVVGPRPLTEADITRLGWSDPSYDWRFEVKPGITGLSQLLAGNGAKASRRFDRYYLRHKNLILDIRLVTISFLANLIGKQAAKKLLWGRFR